MYPTNEKKAIKIKGKVWINNQLLYLFMFLLNTHIYRSDGCPRPRPHPVERSLMVRPLQVSSAPVPQTAAWSGRRVPRSAHLRDMTHLSLTTGGLKEKQPDVSIDPDILLNLIRTEAPPGPPAGSGGGRRHPELLEVLDVVGLCWLTRL